KHLNRHVYSTLENELVYNFNLSDSGTIACKAYFNENRTYGYIFDNVDSSTYRLALQNSQGNLKLILGSNIIDTYINIPINEWCFILLSWEYLSCDPEKGHSYLINVRTDYGKYSNII